MSTKRADKAFEALDKLYEFDREPVSPDKLHSWRYFAALFAGEHVAGTEFVIGALFVAWGVRTTDVILGLILGNTLAVLTWTLLCVPIAVDTRLTLYWYLRRIAGPAVTMVYNVLNAILFSILGGCMITVSASSIRMLFGIPAQTQWYPQDMRFVVLVLCLGSVVVALAVLGFKKLAQFSEVCAPWMFIMFIAGGLVMLPGLALKTGFGDVHGLGDFWRLADTAIWTGKAPSGPSMSFWQVAAFAWVCNLATHAGLSDMALFRYAKSVPCGLTSAVGMFFGHYVAWIGAGIMGAAASRMLNLPMDKLDAGAIASNALGVAGAIAVVLAGWTTSNPTLYRAGLAFQAVTPGWPRWAVTLAAGVATTIMACFPFVFTQLLNFVGWLGLLLMPVGAIVFVEHWIFGRIGLVRYWASRKGLIVNWPALVSWGLAVGTAVMVDRMGIIHRFHPTGRPDGDKFFLFIPIWILTSVLYTVLAAVAGAGRSGVNRSSEGYEASSQSEPPASAASPPPRPDAGLPLMLWGSGAIAGISLVGCVALPIWVFAKGTSGYDQRIVWLHSTILWMSLVHLGSATVWAFQKAKRAGGF